MKKLFRNRLKFIFTFQQTRSHRGCIRGTSIPTRILLWKFSCQILFFPAAPNAIPNYAQRPALGDHDSKPILQCVEGLFWLLAASACGRYCAELLIFLHGSLYFVFNYCLTATPGKFFIMNKRKKKSCSPKMYSAPSNLKTWPRVCQSTAWLRSELTQTSCPALYFQMIRIRRQTMARRTTTKKSTRVRRHPPFSAMTRKTKVDSIFSNYFFRCRTRLLPPVRSVFK